MFNNSKYAKVLTVILIVSIIAIVGIIGIIGYRIYNAYYIETGATSAATEFEDTVANAIQQNTVTQSDIEGIVDSSNADDFNLSTNGSTTKYKGFNVIGTIQIPSINLKYPILEKVTKKSLETSVALLYTAKGLNKTGNSVIIGHNYRNGTMFSNLDKLDKGDIINITDTTGKKIKYTIYKIYRTSGNDGEYVTRNTNGKREISLSTCTDDSKARTIVLAKEN